jgi:hypothetical protein
LRKLRTTYLPAATLLLPALLTAQTPNPAARRAAIAKSSEAPASRLPVTRVSLYKNGVGFFEHAGRVTGNQSITIDFTSAQLNDVLQSLTAVDLNGGRISGAAYNSTTPLEQQLKALPLALTEDPTSVDLYNAIRGARVEVHSGTASITGRLLNIEVVTTPAPDSQTANKPATEKRLITVVSDAGAVHTLELTSTTSVRLLDPTLQNDVNRYLQLLSNNRSQGLRHLTLQDNGSGARDLRVSYISEVPIWKSTYRILFTDSAKSNTTKQTATLQGWAVVDNTVGTDWLNVQLSLIAGAPQSFIQPLSQPIYSRRPEIPIAQEAQLTPQTHESGEMPSPPPPVASPAVGGPMAKAVRGYGSGSGSVGGLMGGSVAQSVTVNAKAAPMLEYESAAAQSLIPQTTTNAFDDYFEYKIIEPVTIRKNESALVPILQTKIDSERVTLWSPSQPTPLRALWITNTSNLTLDRGSFAIVENGNFGGEGLLDPIHPNERRLLSYAADQAVRVTTDYTSTHNTHRVQHITISKGVLLQTTLDVNEVEYIVRNAAPDARTVVIEHPNRQDWTIDCEDTGSKTPKPDETTPTTHRFRVEVPTGQSVHLHIGERHPGITSFRLTNSSEDQLALILRNANASPALMQQLEPVFAAKRTLTGLDRQIKAKQDEVNTITQDQNRLRENMKALKGSPEERTLTTRYTNELNQQEDRLAALHKDLDSLNQQHQTATEDLSKKIESLNIDENL